MVIFNAIDHNMNVALESDWWSIINEELMPSWAYLCYLDFNLKDKSRFIFNEITRFVLEVKASPFKANYLEFIEESEASWNVTEEMAMKGERKKSFDQNCLIV